MSGAAAHITTRSSRSKLSRTIWSVWRATRRRRCTSTTGSYISSARERCGLLWLASVGLGHPESRPVPDSVHSHQPGPGQRVSPRERCRQEQRRNWTVVQVASHQGRQWVPPSHALAPRYLDLLPRFHLVSAHRDRAGEGFTRVYELASKDVQCHIQEAFAADVLT